MSFDTLSYLIFLPAVTLLHWLCPHHLRWVVLLTASLFFYAAWNMPLTLLLLTVIISTYLTGFLIAKTKHPGKKHLLLISALAICVGLMLYFKYFHFLAENLAGFLHILGYERKWNIRDIVLPVGISFYSFQAMSYVIDVYRNPTRMERHFGYYALYISFFPQLVAGPIERADRLLPQLYAERTLNRNDMEMGLRLLLSGYFRKIVLADFCSGYVQAIYSAVHPDGSAVFFATLLFSVQIYNDFAGYSEIAQGSARLLGIKLMQNFDHPYFACGFHEFWRRWHISLTRWFTDYVYIPLGGNRKGLFRQIIAVFLVFLLSGLWHGAKWGFVVWGLCHGLMLISETLILFSRESHKETSERYRLVYVLLTFLAVSFFWIFFRTDSLPRAFFLIEQLFSRWHLRAGIAALGIQLFDILWLLFALLQRRLLFQLTQESDRHPKDMTYVYLLLCIALAWLIRLEQNGQNAFIYFQF